MQVRAGGWDGKAGSQKWTRENGCTDQSGPQPQQEKPRTTSHRLEQGFCILQAIHDGLIAFSGSARL
jgi:hypothetical protein